MSKLDIKFTRLTPFKRCVLQNFPFIEEDFDALTNYGLLCKVVAYLNKVIDSQNEVQGVTEEIVTAFNNLYDYVNNFFDNLDVQEEINNKLDDMAEAGTLQEIIGEYLNATAVWGFDTVADMKASTNLIDGSFARTLGYYTKNDGGSGLYKIRNITNDDVVDDGSIIEIGDTPNTLIAELVTEDSISPLQFGCYGDGTHDDVTQFQKAVTYAETNKLKLVSDGDKTYKVSSTINVDTLICDLNDATITATGAIDIFTINSVNYYGNISHITFDCTNARSAIYISNGRKKTFTDLIINNVREYGIYYNTGYEILIKDSHINGKTTASGAVGINMNGSDSKVSNVILIDCHTAIINHGANFFEYIHAWIQTSSLVSDSVMFSITGNSSTYDQCYSDTYYKTFDITSGTVIVDQMKVFYNQNIYADTEPSPYLFFYPEGTTESRNSVTNSVISGVRSTQKLYFANIAGITKCSNNNLVWVLNYKGGITYTPTTSTEAITSIITNDCIIKNGVMYINLLFVIDTTIGGAFSFSTIPTQYRPTADVNMSIDYGNTQWSQSGNGYLYIHDKISGSVPTTGNGTKYVKIVCSYPIENENY